MLLRDITRSEFCTLTKINPASLDSLLRRFELPFERETTGRYTNKHVLATVCAELMIEQIGLTRKIAVHFSRTIETDNVNDIYRAGYAKNYGLVALDYMKMFAIRGQGFGESIEGWAHELVFEPSDLFAGASLTNAASIILGRAEAANIPLSKLATMRVGFLPTDVRAEFTKQQLIKVCDLGDVVRS